MYGANPYKRVEVEYPSDASQTARQTDANLSNYNTQLSRTVLHDENRYSDTQIRPKATGKYEYVHEHDAPPTKIGDSVTSLPYEPEPASYVPLRPVKPTSIDAPSVRSTKAPPDPSPPEHVVVAAPSVSTRPQAVQTEDAKALELANHRKLVHDTKSSIMAKKENYRKCKRRNRLFMFIFVIFVFLLFAVVRRMMNHPK